jgi:hypothetical protein
MFKYLAYRPVEIFKSDERLLANIPVKDAIETLRALSKETITHRRKYMSLDDIIYIIFRKLGRFSIGNLLERRPDIDSDDVDLSRIDQVIESLRGVRGELVTIQYIVSLMPRKSVVPLEALEKREPDPLADLLPERPAHMQQIGPLQMAIELGTPYPEGTSPSDPLTEAQALNLYNLFWSLCNMLNRTRQMMGIPSLEGIEQVEERNRDRSLFLV